MAGDEGFYKAAERRIEYLTIGVGAAATLVAAWGWGWRAATGMAVGCALSWLNYRWLKQGVAGLVTLSTVQAGAAKPRIPKRVYAKFLGRYVLLIAGAYVILTRFSLPAMALLGGLFAVVAAVLLELIYELVRGSRLHQEG
jgi:uncharacterized membrane protein YvlD (DUF360 family)